VGAQRRALKTVSADEFRLTIDEVRAGRVALSRRVREQIMVRSYCNSGGERARGQLEGLTRRETQVLTHIAQGLSVKEIATTLNVSIKTVEGHKANLMTKLDIHDRVLLAHHAIRQGLVSVWSGDGVR
jgi:DNA-binding NarL/FixJ family response regulator